LQCQCENTSLTKISSGLHRFKIHCNWYVVTSEDVHLRQVFGLFGVQFRQVSLSNESARNSFSINKLVYNLYTKISWYRLLYVQVVVECHFRGSFHHSEQNQSPLQMNVVRTFLSDLYLISTLSTLFEFWCRWNRTMLNFYRPFFMPCFGSHFENGRHLENFENTELLL
jgi:hypothetical protein